jgi:mannose-6-phosphate isomerase-like protein (cupin superfamily)
MSNGDGGEIGDGHEEHRCSGGPRPGPTRPIDFAQTPGRRDRRQYHDIPGVPAGKKSYFHLHHDSDEVAYVVSGEVTFMIGDEVTVGGPGSCTFMPRGVPHCWKGTGAETSQVLFLYTPAKAGGLIEEQQRTGRKFGSMDERELADILERHGWEFLGPSPL